AGPPVISDDADRSPQDLALMVAWEVDLPPLSGSKCLVREAGHLGPWKRVIVARDEVFPDLRDADHLT
ncbi:MAG: hypothetical protein QGG73_13990, partial [Candidatus Hydrogenedentes bacterium]|nr:hypothetical protein [Candidatus Hydrogenedentota bacterium]